jgi:threonine synthase
MLDILRKSGGTAVSVTDDELIAAVREIGSAEGIFAAPEGAACLPALKELLERGEVDHNDRIVLFNTGTGVKYLEAFQR